MTEDIDTICGSVTSTSTLREGETVGGCILGGDEMVKGEVFARSYEVTYHKTYEVINMNIYIINCISYTIYRQH